jgi:hypothetical protein
MQKLKQKKDANKLQSQSQFKDLHGPKRLNWCFRLKNILWGTFLAFGIFSFESTHAQLLKHWNQQEVPYIEIDHLKIQPNEKYPRALAPLIKGSHKGVYVAVGTERGFIGGSLRNETSGIILVDIEPNVFFFNSVNVGLLMARHSHQHYRRLRLTADINEWTNAAMSIDDPELKHFMLSPSTYQWWVVHVRNHFNQFHRPTDHSWLAFFKANYIFEEVQYRRLKRLADRKMILPILGNLKLNETINSIRQVLLKEGEMISVLDLSNAWWPKLLGISGTEDTVQGLMDVLHDNSKLILTTYKKINPQNTSDRWKYFGSHVRNLYPIKQMSFYEFLRTMIVDHRIWSLRRSAMDPHLTKEKEQRLSAKEQDNQNDGESETQHDGEPKSLIVFEGRKCDRALPDKRKDLRE